MAIYDLMTGTGVIKVGTMDEENEILTLETVSICLGPNKDCRLECREVAGQLELFFVRPDLSEVQVS